MSDEPEERTYTQAELDAAVSTVQLALARAHQAALRVQYDRLEQAGLVAAREAYALGQRETLQKVREARAGGYEQGVVAEGRCEAAAPVTGVLCGLPAGHPLGELDRHKALVGDNPHEAVSWNE